MPSKTPQYQIPYPLPTDSVSNGAADMRNLAERVEAVIKSVPKGPPGEAGTAGSGILATYSPSNWRNVSATNVAGTSFGSITVANPGRAWTPRVYGNFEAGQFGADGAGKAVIEARIGSTVVARAVGPNTSDWQGLTLCPVASKTFTGSQTVYFYLLNAFGSERVNVTTFYANALIDVYAA